MSRERPPGGPVGWDNLDPQQRESIGQLLDRWAKLYPRWIAIPPPDVDSPLNEHGVPEWAKGDRIRDWNMLAQYVPLAPDHAVRDYQDRRYRAWRYLTLPETVRSPADIVITIRCRINRKTLGVVQPTPEGPALWGSVTRRLVKHWRVGLPSEVRRDGTVGILDLLSHLEPRVVLECPRCGQQGFSRDELADGIENHQRVLNV